MKDRQMDQGTCLSSPNLQIGDGVKDLTDLVGVVDRDGDGMGGRESIVTKRRLNRFKDKAVENSCLRAHMVGSNVLSVGSKPVGKILLFAS